jgi:hypothetical protein
VEQDHEYGLQTYILQTVHQRSDAAVVGWLAAFYPTLSIHGTSTTNGGQGFAGVNLGTINYARSENKSGTVH